MKQVRGFRRKKAAFPSSGIDCMAYRIPLVGRVCVSGKDGSTTKWHLGECMWGGREMVSLPRQGLLFDGTSALYQLCLEST